MNRELFVPISQSVPRDTNIRVFCWRESSRVEIPDRRRLTEYTRRVTQKNIVGHAYRMLYARTRVQIGLLFHRRELEISGIERSRGTSSSADTRDSAFKAPVGQRMALKSPVSVTEIAKSGE
ncbi:hypothetical protein ACS0PU_000268 [Formica fusca]